MLAFDFYLCAWFIGRERVVVVVCRRRSASVGRATGEWDDAWWHTEWIRWNYHNEKRTSGENGRKKKWRDKKNIKNENVKKKDKKKKTARTRVVHSRVPGTCGGWTHAFCDRRVVLAHSFIYLFLCSR